MRSATCASAFPRAHLRNLTPVPKDQLLALKQARLLAVSGWIETERELVNQAIERLDALYLGRLLYLAEAR